jgi:IS30 family transposase
MLTIVDRKSRLVRIEKLEGQWASGVHAATVKPMWRLKVRSITNDVGLEFSSFKETSETLKVPVFFPRAHASWERGSIENMNWLTTSEIHHGSVLRPPR